MSISVCYLLNLQVAQFADLVIVHKYITTYAAGFDYCLLMSFKTCDFNIPFGIFAAVNNMIALIFGFVDYKLQIKIINICSEQVKQFVPKILLLLKCCEDFEVNVDYFKSVISGHDAHSLSSGHFVSVFFDMASCIVVLANELLFG